MSMSATQAKNTIAIPGEDLTLEEMNEVCPTVVLVQGIDFPSPSPDAFSHVYSQTPTLRRSAPSILSESFLQPQTSHFRLRRRANCRPNHELWSKDWNNMEQVLGLPAKWYVSNDNRKLKRSYRIRVPPGKLPSISSLFFNKVLCFGSRNQC